ncbi:MAG TPA: hypothetical protein VNI01_05255 [Elusimicrobiota bacterium]|jgi:hypothetical protein|nr:hypothetical protein [Elusimicrobiota bacterium]
MNGQKGATLLEVMVVAVLLSAFVYQMSGVWASYDRQLTTIADRVDLDREARVARALMLQDFNGASSLSLDASDHFRLLYSTPGSPEISYSLSGNSLVRTSSAGPWSMTAARHVDAMSCSLSGDPARLSAELDFSKNRASLSLTMYQVFVSTS